MRLSLHTIYTFTKRLSSTCAAMFSLPRPFYLALNENDIITRWNSLWLHDGAVQWRVCLALLFSTQTLPRTRNFFLTKCEITFIASVQMKSAVQQGASFSFSRWRISTSKHICQLLFDLFLTSSLRSTCKSH
jgi:hypothetical protein